MQSCIYNLIYISYKKKKKEQVRKCNKVMHVLKDRCVRCDNLLLAVNELCQFFSGEKILINLDIRLSEPFSFLL